MKVGVVTTGALGWKSVGMRWKQHLPQRVGHEPLFLEIQDFEGWEAKTPVVRRHAWFRALLRGRRAAKAAIQAGCDQILLCTIVDAPLLPRVAKVRYLIYGDATPHQLDVLYYGKREDTPRKRFLRRKVGRLAADGHAFLCMSPWYGDAVAAEYGARPDQIHILRPLLDTTRWSPPESRLTDGPWRALFVGGDFERKGGDLVLQLAERISPERLQWDLVTPETRSGPAHARFHNGLTPDSDTLVELTRSAHCMVFPTRADCSPNAVLEAAATGLPVVSTDVGGLPDMVHHGVTGMLLKPDDVAGFEQAILGYLDTPRMAEEHGGAGRALVERNNSVETHFSVLLGALGARASTAS